MPNATAAARRPPLARAGFLTAAQAGRLAKQARHLLRAGLLTHHQLALLDCLLWSCRQPGRDMATASYSALSRLAHMARDTVSTALDALEQHGLLQRIKRRVVAAWPGGNGGVASRQETSCYRLIAPEPDAPCTESSERTVIQGIEITYAEKPQDDDAKAAQRALEEVRRQREAAIREQWGRRRTV